MRDVGEHRVDRAAAERLEQAVAVIRLHDDLDSAKRFEQCFEPVAVQSLIIRQRNSHHAARGSGRVARRTQPRGARRFKETTP
jgi:hypothetical protein